MIFTEAKNVEKFKKEHILPCHMDISKMLFFYKNELKKEEQDNTIEKEIKDIYIGTLKDAIERMETLLKILFILKNTKLSKQEKRSMTKRFVKQYKKEIKLLENEEVNELEFIKDYFKRKDDTIN